MKRLYNIKIASKVLAKRNIPTTIFLQYSKLPKLRIYNGLQK